MISSTKLIVLIFASLIIRDTASSEQQQQQQPVKDTTTRVKDAPAGVPAKDPRRNENVGKIWNWTFDNTGSFPTTITTTTTDESKSKLKKEPEPSFKRPIVDADDDSNASASGFKKSFLRKAAADRSDGTKPRASVPLRNLERLRDGMRRNDKANCVDCESGFEDSVSFDSLDDDSQSYGSSQFYDEDDDDDDDDLSDNQYFGRFPRPSQTANKGYPTSFSMSKSASSTMNRPSSHPPSIPTIPVQRPATQVRSVGMQPRSLQMIRSPARRRYGRRGGDSQGM